MDDDIVTRHGAEMTNRHRFAVAILPDPRRSLKGVGENIQA
jgi:hypothetical protein